MKKQAEFKSLLSSEGFRFNHPTPTLTLIPTIILILILILIQTEDFHWKDVWAKYDTTADGTVDQEEFFKFYSEVHIVIIIFFFLLFFFLCQEHSITILH